MPLAGTLDTRGRVKPGARTVWVANLYSGSDWCVKGSPTTLTPATTIPTLERSDFALDFGNAQFAATRGVAFGADLLGFSKLQPRTARVGGALATKSSA